jgi:phage-related protein
MAANSAQVTFAFLAKDAASKTIRGISKALGAVRGAASKLGGALKTSLKIGTAALAGLAAGAIGAAAAFAKGAIEDEAANNRLIAVLQKRKLATDANLKAVDALIEKGAELAFTDDEVRAGIATATQFTKKFTDAQRIHAVAQDVARAKNIGLEEATALVGKAYQGNTKGLKTLGVETKKGANGLAVLTSISNKFGTSAAAYAETTQGKIESLGITLSETGEQIGYALLPILNELLTVFKKDGIPIIKNFADGISNFITENKEAIKGIIGTVVAVGKRLIPVFQKVGEFIFTKVLPPIRSFIENLVKPGGVADSIGQVVGPILDKLVPAFGAIFDAAVRIVGKVGELAAALWDNGNGPLAVAVKLLGAAFEIFFGILGKILGVIEAIIDAAIDAVNWLKKMFDAERAGQNDKFLRMGGINPVSLGGSGMTPTGTGAVAPGFNQYYNVYVGATSVAEAVVPVLARNVGTTPRGGR